MADESLQGLPVMLNEAATAVGAITDSISPRLRWKEVGTVTSVLPGIAKIKGLPSVALEEVIEFENGSRGIAFNLDENEIGAVLISTEEPRAGMEVERTGRLVEVPVGEELLGRVIDPVGNPLDKLGPVLSRTRMPIEGDVVPILHRAAVQEPLFTGIKVIDTMVPIGKGQRELILGDRQTGKTAIAIDTIINQKDRNVVCIYCAIGRRSSAIASVLRTLKDKGCLDYTVAVVAEGHAQPGLRFIAPYAATTIAEYFMNRGQDALIIYDDLTCHARTYREISLLLRRPPGREAFPGDIFYIHSRLLERSTHLIPRLGGGSLTALPIIETQAQDISAYIPTNLISITDGQLYLSSSLFQKNLLPAIDIGKSVSRVGGKAQPPYLARVALGLKLTYSQFEELETFSRFGTRLDPATASALESGRRLRHCLTQPRYDPVDSLEQLLIFHAYSTGLFDRIPLDRLREAELACRALGHQLPASLRIHLHSRTSAPRDSEMQSLRALLESALTRFHDEPGRTET